MVKECLIFAKFQLWKLVHKGNPSKVFRLNCSWSISACMFIGKMLHCAWDYWKHFNNLRTISSYFLFCNTSLKHASMDSAVSILGKGKDRTAFFDLTQGCKFGFHESLPSKIEVMSLIFQSHSSPKKTCFKDFGSITNPFCECGDGWKTSKIMPWCLIWCSSGTAPLGGQSKRLKWASLKTNGQ